MFAGRAWTGLINAGRNVCAAWRCFPPTLHFKKPNPNFRFSRNSPFSGSNSERAEWSAERRASPRRRQRIRRRWGRNAHVVDRANPPERAFRRRPARPNHLLVSVCTLHRRALERGHRQSRRAFEIPSGFELGGRCMDTASPGRRSFDCRPRQWLPPIPKKRSARFSTRDREHVQTRLKPIDAPEVLFSLSWAGVAAP